MLARVKEVLGNFSGQYAEVRVEHEDRTQVRYEKDNLENLETSSEFGGFVRVLHHGGWGIATFNDFDKLAKQLETARHIADTVSRSREEPVRLAPVEVFNKRIEVELEQDFREVELDEKRKLMAHYNELMLSSDDRIETTTTRYTDSLREIIYANTEGTAIEQEIPDVTLALVAVARGEGRNIQRAQETFGEAAGFEVARDKDSTAEEVASRSLELLEAKPVEGGKYPVILDPKLAGVFIHEAFGHLCEADHIYQNDRLREIMKLGREFGPRDLNVVDDGYIPGRRGNVPYDDEGVPRKKTYLIKEGKLNSFLHSRQTAAKMNSEPTGNARAVSYRHQPIVRMTNTYIEQGPVSFEEMLSGIDRGIYARDAFGGQTQLEQFTFSAAYA
ncbi:MAG: TldD/PmbA family protein, partial [Candidatus Acetothermia bacterium]